MEIRGFEPLTSSLQSWRSSQLSYIPVLVLPMANVLPLANFKSQTGNYQSALLQNINRFTALHSKNGMGREEVIKRTAFYLNVWIFGAVRPRLSVGNTPVLPKSFQSERR